MKNHLQFRLPLFIGITGILLLAASCKKDTKSSGDTTTNKAKTKSEILTSHTWKLSAATCTPQFFGSSDLYSMMDACEKDNVMSFKNDADKTYVINEGSDVCNGHDQETKSTWLFQDNDTKLVAGSTTYSIIDLDETHIKGSTQISMDGMWYTVTCTYTAQ